MSDYNKCKLCHEWHFSSEKCKPKFEYQIPVYHGEDEWCEVRAYSFREAAERACEKSDSDGDYTIIGYGGLDLIYVKDSNGIVKSFSIEARQVPEYNAREIESEVKR